MWQRKSKPGTPKRNRKTALKLPLLLLLCAGCRPEPPPDPVAEQLLSIRIAPLHDYAWQDRTQSGQPADFKPPHETEALHRALLSAPNPDVLVVRGIGSENSLLHLRNALGDQNLSYQSIYTPGATPFVGLGFLVKNSLTAHPGPITPSPYSVGPRSHLPLVGSLQLTLSDSRNLTLVNAQWPDPDAPYEHRRNQARLLTQALREPVQNGDLLLLSLHSREDPDSPMMRSLHELGLVVVNAQDDRGDAWTFRDPDGLNYQRDQWLFASPALARNIQQPAQILDAPDLRTAGPYRHQTIRLKKVD